MSGLAAGIRLAHYEQKVLVLEKHAVLGGLNSFYKRDGRMFDVGLHAVTNYVPEGTRGAPLTKLLRQLRIRHAEFDLTPQGFSDIRFPGVTLKFSNDFELLRSEIADRFPAEIDGFDQLVERIRTANSTTLDAETLLARTVLAEYLRDPLLTDMILAPCFYYGSAREDDMDWNQFLIMFQSLFFEGFARPRAGVRTIIQVLRKKLLGLGGELRMKTGVRELEVREGKVAAVHLENGETLTANRILSSAGHVETLRMCSDTPEEELPPAGRLGFVETISVLDTQPKDLGYDATITFFSTRERLAYRQPDELVDVTSGVICAPSNYAYDEPLEEGMIRLTSLADYRGWEGLAGDEYAAAKKRWYDAQVEEVVTKVIPDFRPHVVYVDSFTPNTIKKFTFHDNGAIYGAPNKVKDGRTHAENLFLCGTDQGFLGIIGAMLSGISMANLHMLR